MNLAISTGLSGPATGAWWPAGAVFAADFLADRYMVAGRPVRRSEAIAFARPSPRWAADRAGVWRAFGPDEPALTNRGLQLLAAARNEVTNSALIGARPDGDDRLSGLPNAWGAHRFDGDGLRARVVATGTVLGLPYMDIRLSGTGSIGDAQINMASPVSDQVPVVPGDTVLLGGFLQVVAGSLAGVAVRYRLSLHDATGRYLDKRTVDIDVTPDLQPIARSLPVNTPQTQLVRPGFEFSLPGGHDVTLRIAAPHAEKTTATTVPAPILTEGTPRAVAEDRLTLALPPGPVALTIVRSDGAIQTIPAAGGPTRPDPRQTEPAPLVAAWAG